MILFDTRISNTSCLKSKYIHSSNTARFHFLHNATIRHPQCFDCGTPSPLPRLPLFESQSWDSPGMREDWVLATMCPDSVDSVTDIIFFHHHHHH